MLSFFLVAIAIIIVPLFSLSLFFSLMKSKEILENQLGYTYYGKKGMVPNFAHPLMRSFRANAKERERRFIEKG